MGETGGDVAVELLGVLLLLLELRVAVTKGRAALRWTKVVRGERPCMLEGVGCGFPSVW